MTNRPRRVLIRELEHIGSVGVYEHEHRYQQRIVVSLDMQVVDNYDGTSDQLGAVYDYDLAIRAIKQTIDDGHFNLIATIAERVAEACLADDRVLEVCVRVEKPDVLPSCRAVGIEIRRGKPAA